MENSASEMGLMVLVTTQSNTLLLKHRGGEKELLFNLRKLY